MQSSVSKPVIAGAAFAAIVAVAHLLSSPILALLGSRVVTHMDQAVHGWAQDQSGPTVLAFMKLVSDLNSTVGTLVLASLVAWRWHRVGRKDLALQLAFAVPVGMLLNVLVKTVIHRVRPEWAVVPLPGSFSFPSGHVAQATVFYGSVASGAASACSRLGWKVLAVVLALAMVGLVACSRIMLGVHYFSDCVGAVIEGVLWLAACHAGSWPGRSAGNAP